MLGLKKGGEKMKVVGMFGSRYGGDEKIVLSLLMKMKKEVRDELVVLVGDCVGVDEMVYKGCKKLGIKVGVLKVWKNWDKLSYEVDEEDIVEVVGEGVERLRDRLRMRSMRLVEKVKEMNGVLVGYKVEGKGSRLVIREGLRRGVRVYVVDEEKKRLVRV